MGLAKDVISWTLYAAPTGAVSEVNIPIPLRAEKEHDLIHSAGLHAV
jgi:hypothetical protein